MHIKYLTFRQQIGSSQAIKLSSSVGVYVRYPDTDDFESIVLLLCSAIVQVDLPKVLV